MGICGVPFMNTTTSLLLTSLSMNCSMPMAPILFSARPRWGGDRFVPYVADRQPKPKPPRRSRLRYARLKGKRMQRAAHLPAQGFVHQLVLLHPRLAAERFGDHRRRIMVAVAGEIADGHRGV